MHLRFWKKTAIVLSVVLLTGAIDFMAVPIKASATSSSITATQSQIDKTEKDKKNLENQVESAEGILSGLEGDMAELMAQLSNLNAQMAEVAANLESLEQQIRDKEQQIADTQAALDEAKATEEWQYDSMVMRIRCMYERREDSYLTMLLSAVGLADLLNLADNIEKVAAYERSQLEKFKENRIRIEEEEEKLQTERAELRVLQAAAEAERNRVNGLVAETRENIAEYEDQIAEAEQKLKEYEEALKKKEEDLEALKKKLAEEIALSQAAANAAWRDISEVEFAEDDLYLLANLIYCEAGGEPYEGQLAVGAVVMNRVLSSRYPNTVIGVIYQKSQFSPVGNGRLELALAINKATPRCYQAAQEAMSGMTNVGNCLYFRTPIPGLTGIQIGGHIFY